MYIAPQLRAVISITCPAFVPTRFSCHTSSSVKQWPVQQKNCKVRRCGFSEDLFLINLLSCSAGINAYGNALCTPVPKQKVSYLNSSMLSSYLVEATYSAPNPPSTTNAPNNISALPICAVSFLGAFLGSETNLAM